MYENHIILRHLLLSMLLVALAAGTESNSVSYWIEQGNIKFGQGDYIGAAKCYDNAINLGNQTNSPIFTEIFAQSRYRMTAVDSNNFTHAFSETPAEPAVGNRGQPDSSGLTFSFDASNPNNMHMRIGSIYVEVINYNPIINPKIIQNFGKGYTRGYFCYIEPTIGSYKCNLTSKDYDFIDLSPTELENIAINVNTDTPGAYKLRIGLEYAIGSETYRIIVGEVPGVSSFFDRNLIKEAR